MNKRVINTSKAPLSTSPVSQCNIVNNTIYIGGQMPRDLDSGLIVEGGYNQAKLSPVSYTHLTLPTRLSV